tara:strand:- start:2848 stop:3975 length:1128 start_codon:yes stop_codon:yes gene_type:complete
MDFETQVEALTGLGIGLGITTAQLTQFLTDGVIDVTQRCIAVQPSEASNFLKGEESDTQGALGEGLSNIVTVIRESGTSSDWRSCRPVSNDLQSRVTDVNSIHYSSKFNPAYLIDNKGKVLVYPTPSAGGANSYKVYYVNNVPVNGSYATLLHSHDTIGYFPKNKVYLVVMYASIKSIDHLVESLQDLPSNLGDITLGVPVLPTPPTLSSTSLSFTTTAPTYTPPVVSPDFSDANNWINTEEDSEMSASRVQVINAQIQEYQTNLQNALNVFNKENAIYQIEYQRSVQNAQLTEKSEDQLIQKYQSELTAYSAKVNQEIQAVSKLGADIQKYNAEMQKAKLNVELYMQRSMKIQKDYDTAFQIMYPAQPKQKRSK